MKKNLLTILFLLLSTILFSQDNQEWRYFFDSNRLETKQKLNQYLNFHNYKGLIVEKDSTIELTTTYDSTWTIYSIFYFDEQGKCYALSNRRCDSIGRVQRQKLLSDKNYGWKKISENKYLSWFSKCELLEFTDINNCTMYKWTKLDVTRKEYKAILNKVK